jgi:hypothetical protein
MGARHLAVVFALLSIALPAALLPAQQEQPAAPPAADAEPPPVPKGVEVLARGPVHEAFASLATEPTPSKPVAKKPRKALDELPPADKPEGNVQWISGYWAWDDERSDFLWVSGVWRSPPPGKQWIAGYWREEGEQWQWVPGFWTAAAAPAQQGEQEATKQITYLPQPPASPEVAPPGRPPADDTFYVPGSWVWTGSSYAWRAGYWARVQAGYVWVPDHYRWSPSGYVYIPGYWDYALSRRGVLYAPVVVDPTVVTVGFYYSPAYAVSDAVVVDALFVRPAYTHYYFGDYYGPTYVALGFESGYVYSQRRYDSIVVYESWYHRDTPNWVGVQIDIYSGRTAGRLPVPPRTLVQQNTIIQQNITNMNVTNITNNTNVTNNTTNVTRNVTNYNSPVLAPTAQVAAAKGMKTVPLDTTTRQQAQQQASAVQQVAAQRTQTETPLPPGAPRQARVASLSVPQTKPVQPGFTAPPAPRMPPSAPTAAAASPAGSAAAGRAAAQGPASASPSGTHNVAPSPTAPPGRAGATAVAPTQPGRPAPGQPGVTPSQAGRPGTPPSAMPRPSPQPRPQDRSKRPPPGSSNDKQRSP